MMMVSGIRVLTGCLMLSVLTACPVMAQNLRNGSFEEPELQQDNPWGDLAAGWGRWGNWINRETAWEPTHSGKCLIGYHHWEIQEDDASGIFQDIPALPAGTACTFSIFASKDKGTNIESIELRIEKKGGFEPIASRVYSLDELRGRGWTKLSVSGVAQDGGMRVLVSVTPKQGGDREGAVKFDDAELTFHAPESE